MLLFVLIIQYQLCIWSFPVSHRLLNAQMLTTSQEKFKSGFVVWKFFDLKNWKQIKVNVFSKRSTIFRDVPQLKTTAEFIYYYYGLFFHQHFHAIYMLSSILVVYLMRDHILHFRSWSLPLKIVPSTMFGPHVIAYRQCMLKVIKIMKTWNGFVSRMMW